MDIRKSISSLGNDALRSDRIFFKKVETERDLWSMGSLYLNEDQADLVNPLWFSLGRAYIKPEENLPCLIFRKEDSKLIGFIQLCRFLGCEEEAVTWSLFIIPEYQRMGYGKESVILATKILRSAFPTLKIKVAVEQANIRAQRLYNSLGLSFTGEMDGNDFVYKF
jgi:RimJ/RimL family protein N-acetyltransferase